VLATDDFEDAAVMAVAEASGSTFVVTRNVADFAPSPVRAITPADFFLGQHAPAKLSPP
jgi:hypothetical protein